MIDVVVIGSGFGGAVAAARISEHIRLALGGRHRVVVLDKGVDPTGRFDPDGTAMPLNAQGNRFRHTLAPQYLDELGEVFTDPRGAYRPGVPSMNVIAGKGLGGGSLLYDGVSLRAPAETFEQTRDGRRLWPSAFTRASLNGAYDVVAQQLRVRQMAWTDADAPHWALTTKRDFVFAQGCRSIGATCVPLKLADVNDANEGWWNQGQRFEGRQDLTKNYLSSALASGCEFRTAHEVERIAPAGDGYVVRGVDRRGGKKKPFEIECRVLIVAAGAVASTGLLLRSRDDFRNERALDQGDERLGQPVLGRHLSSNGDYGVSGIVGPNVLPVEGHKGKPMSSFCPSFWPEHKFILIPFHAAPLYLSLGQISSMSPPKYPTASGRASTPIAERANGKPVRDWGPEYKSLLRQFGARVLTMGCLALDECEGEIDADDDRITVKWRETSRATEDRWKVASEKMQSIYAALGGEMFLDTYRRDGTVNSSHPLGGCRMAEDPTEGIVDPTGESFSNPNLFVLDGAIIPSALGVNPSMTIAALAENAVGRLVRGEGTPSLADRLGAQ